MGNVIEIPKKREAFVHPPRTSSGKVGETPGNGEESPSFGEESYLRRTVESTKYNCIREAYFTDAIRRNK